MKDISGAGWHVMFGSCLDRLHELADNSIDAVVTDPPYELGFMGKSWDSSGIAFNPQVWVECLRVLKPGGHLLAFGGSRTWHRIAVAIEDAGFEVRDSIAWLYGSGFPKSLDVSKAIDKSDAAEMRHRRNIEFTAWMRSTGITARRIDELTGTNMGGHYLTEASQPAVATADLFDKLRPYLPDVPEYIERLVAERTVESENYKQREVIGERPAYGIGANGAAFNGHSEGAIARETLPATDDAKKWQGWGTALKPAFEPVVVARKPLTGTVAANVLEWGTGGLNIDGTRVRMSADDARKSANNWKPQGYESGQNIYDIGSKVIATEQSASGRWPANVILDEYTAQLVDQQSGDRPSAGTYRNVDEPMQIGSRNGNNDPDRFLNSVYLSSKRYNTYAGEKGGASRFFYVADTQKHDRMSVCKNTPANNVANYFRTIRAIIESSAQTIADTQPNEQLDQAVKSAEILCDSCATSIAHDLAGLKNLATNAATSTHFQRYIKDCVNSTLSQNLASLVETWVNTDTIPTTTNFGRLFGCVLLATDENTRLENLANGNAPTPFIYQAKANKRDRNEGLDELEERLGGSLSGGNDKRKGDLPQLKPTKNFHPTVKPTDLMRQLVRLVTPPGGVVLDPFTGSGSTGKAAILEGFEFVGVELTEDYLPIIEGRLSHAVDTVSERGKADDEKLF